MSRERAVIAILAAMIVAPSFADPVSYVGTDGSTQRVSPTTPLPTAAAIVGSDGRTKAETVPWGALRVETPSTALMTEAWGTLDTTTRWTAKNSTGTAAVSGGILTISGGASANNYGGIYSQPTFIAKGLTFITLASAINIPNSTIANSYRFWGYGSVPASPTAALPLSNAVGFELRADGSLWGVVWSSGVRTASVDLTLKKPTDNTYTVYAIAVRADAIFFYISDTSTPAGFLTFSAPAAHALPATFMSINGTSNPASAATILSQSFGIGDNGANNQSISDGTYPYIQAAVKAAATAPAVADPALVVAMSPNSTSGSSTDISGTVTTGGTYQTIAGLSATRKNCTIQNPTTATEVLNVKFGTMANPYTLSPGATISTNNGLAIATDAITVTAATAGHAFAGTCQ